MSSENKVDEYNQIVKALGWGNDPGIDMLLKQIYFTRKGNGEKYLKLLEAREKLELSYANCDDDVIRDWLGEVMEILYEDFKHEER